MAFKKNQYYLILSRVNKKALGIENASLENGALVQLQDKDGSDAQQWQAIGGESSFKLINKLSGKALDVVYGGTECGSWVHQWEDLPTDTQQWYLEHDLDG